MHLGETDMADWNAKVEGTAAKIESEVQRLIQYLNDEVVPDVRKQSSSALKIAADRLQELAKSLDDRR